MRGLHQGADEPEPELVAVLAVETATESEVGGRRRPLDAPYEQHEAVLLNVVADANGCRSA